MPVKKTKPKAAAIVFLALILAALAFIWLNSLENIPASAARSEMVRKLLAPLLEPIVGAGNVTDHLVRKLAHFVEFGILGVLLAVFAGLRGNMNLQAVVNCMFFSLAAAVIDETIQLASNRGSQVQDVLLDFAGAVLGIALALFIRGVILLMRYKRGTRVS